MERKEEKQLLKKSGFYSIILLFIVSVFWLLFSTQVSFGYSGTGTTQDLKSGSRFNGDLLAQPLNGSVTIYFGTQSTQGTGTIGYIGTNTAGLPFLRYSFLNGSSSINFNGFGAVYIDGVAIPSAGSLSAKLDSNGGVGTNNVFNAPTLNSSQLAGSTTIVAGSTITIGTNTFSSTKVEYLADVTSPIGAGIDSKLNKIGTTTTYITSVIADGKTGTTSFSLVGGTDASIVSTLNPDGSLVATVNVAGSVSAKADIKEGGTTTVSNSAHIDFDNSEFDISVDGLGASVALSEIAAGTTAASANHNVKLDGTGKISIGQVPTSIVSGAVGSTTTGFSGTSIMSRVSPSNTDGAEILTLAYTPKRVGNLLLVEVDTFGGSNSDAYVMWGLFADSESTPRQTAARYAIESGNNLCPCSFKYGTIVGTTTSQTWKLRAGGASGGDWSVNKVRSGGYTFSQMMTTITILEIYNP